MVVTVVIPSYEPGSALITYIDDLIEAGIDHIYVVDDGSGESYKEIFDKVATHPECTLITHPVNMGKGRALKDAFKYINDNVDDVAGCISVDSDGQHGVKDVLECIRVFKDNSDKLVMGVRDFTLENIPPRNRYGNLILIWMYKWFANFDLKDTQTGLRVYPKEYMQLCINVKGERFDFENRALLAAKENGYDILEVPIETVYQDKEEYKSHYRPIRDSLIAYGIVLSCFFRYIVASLSSSAIDYILFGILSYLLAEKLPTLNIAIATAGARIISSSFNFIVNYKIVFHSSKSILSSAVKYYLLVAIQVVISAVLVSVLSINLGMNKYLSKVIVDGTIFCVNYLIQKRRLF